MQNILILNQPIIRQGSFKLNLKIFWLLNILLIFSFLIFYIVQVNIIFLKTNLIQKYEKKLDEITKENKDLKISLVQTDYSKDIEDQINELGFEKISNIQYINFITENTFANK